MDLKKRKNRNSSAEGEEGEIEDSVSETVQVSDSLALSALFKSVAKLHANLDKLDTLSGAVHGSGGIEKRLQDVTAHTNDQDSSIAEVKEENRKLRKEVELMKSNIIPLKRRLD